MVAVTGLIVFFVFIVFILLLLFVANKLSLKVLAGDFITERKDDEEEDEETGCLLESAGNEVEDVQLGDEGAVIEKCIDEEGSDVVHDVVHEGGGEDEGDHLIEIMADIDGNDPKNYQISTSNDETDENIYEDIFEEKFLLEKDENGSTLVEVDGDAVEDDSFEEHEELSLRSRLTGRSGYSKRRSSSLKKSPDLDVERQSVRSNLTHASRRTASSYRSSYYDFDQQSLKSNLTSVSQQRSNSYNRVDQRSLSTSASKHTTNSYKGSSRRTQSLNLNSFSSSLRSQKPSVKSERLNKQKKVADTTLISQNNFVRASKSAFVHRFASESVINMSINYNKTAHVVSGIIRSVEHLSVANADAPEDISFYCKLKTPKKTYKCRTNWKSTNMAKRLSLTFMLGPIDRSIKVERCRVRVLLFGRKRSSLLSSTNPTVQFLSSTGVFSSKVFARSRCYGECCVAMDQVSACKDGTMQCYQKLYPNTESTIERKDDF